MGHVPMAALRQQPSEAVCDRAECDYRAIGPVSLSLPKTGRTGEIECIRAHNGAVVHCTVCSYQTGSTDEDVDAPSETTPVPFWKTIAMIGASVVSTAANHL